MTKGAALHSFFNSFGIPGHPDTSVPEDQELPYLTYTPVFDSWGSSVSIAVNLWYRTTDDSIPNAKAMELSNRIGPCGVLISCDGGYIWINRGSPFCQGLQDDADKNVKRRYINVTADYLTLN